MPAGSAQLFGRTSGLPAPVPHLGEGHHPDPGSCGEIFLAKTQEASSSSNLDRKDHQAPMRDPRSMITLDT